MPEPEPFYESAERRIEWLTVACGLAGAAFAYGRWGWQASAGVALGGGLSWLNFRWLKQGVGALVKLSTAQAGEEKARVPRSVYVKFFGRFALLWIVAYAILSLSILPAAAVVAGLFSVVAAAMIEMVRGLVRDSDGTGTHA